MVYLVMGDEQVRRLREEKECPNGTARGSSGVSKKTLADVEGR